MFETLLEDLLIDRYVEINAELANQNRAFYSLGRFASLFPDFGGCAEWIWTESRAWSACA